MRKRIRERITEVLDMPKDIVLDMSKIVVVGDKEMIVENYKGVIEYSDCIVRVKTINGIIKVTGSSLQLCTITDEDIMIEGCIKCIEFMR